MVARLLMATESVVMTGPASEGENKKRVASEQSIWQEAIALLHTHGRGNTIHVALIRPCSTLLQESCVVIVGYLGFTSILMAHGDATRTCETYSFHSHTMLTQVERIPV